MSTIPIADPSLGRAETERIKAVIDDGQLADGPEVRQFEAEFATRSGAAQAVATSNGTTALHAALRAVGIGPGDVVVTTPFSFVATANAVRHCGATPVFADIDPETYNLDPAAVEAVVRERDDVDAILPVHLYGLPADMDALLDVAARYDLTVIEDAAQAHGAIYRDSPVGTLGDAGCFSFYPTKNMTTGEGGMIVTNRAGVESRARRFIDHGADGEEGHVEVGHNFRMTSIAAAIGRVQLDKLPEYTRLRRRNARLLTEGLADITGVDVPAEPSDRRHVYHQYTIRCADRSAIQSALEAADIDSAVYYPTPIHRQPAYADVEGEFPAAERAAAEVLSLPVNPSISPADVAEITETIRQAVAPRARVADE